jgi:hypothetical protein
MFKTTVETRPIEHRLIMGLWRLQDLCHEFIRSTCAGCERTERQRGFCIECEDVDALHWQICNFRVIFESAVVSFLELRTRQASERKGGAA